MYDVYILIVISGVAPDRRGRGKSSANLVYGMISYSCTTVNPNLALWYSRCVLREFHSTIIVRLYCKVALRL